MKKAILSIDQGTTSTRAIVFSLESKIISSAQLEHQQIFPQNGWVEHNPQEILDNTQEVVAKALKSAQDKGYQAVTVGITNQRETIVAWDKSTGEILHNALVWQDKRTADKCEKLKKSHGEMVTQKTGLPLDPYFSATKMQWLLENIEAVKLANQNKTLAFGTMDSFLLYKLTNGKVHATDITNACRTLLFNIHTQEWDSELLELFNIPLETLPQIMDNNADFGVMEFNPETFEQAELNSKKTRQALPIQGMAGDQQAASIGQACFEVGMLKSTYGTGCFAMLNTGQTAKTSQNGLLTTVLYKINGELTYGLEGSVFVAGSAVQWLRDKLEIIKSAEDTQGLAEQSVAKNPHDNVYIVPAFVGLGVPYWNSQVKAVISGLTLDSDKADIVRATLESISFQTYDLLEAMQADMQNDISQLRVDGGMVANNWLMQNMADILNVNIQRPKVTETTALGVAYLAGLQHGLYKSLEEISQFWKSEQEFTPQMDTKIREQKILGWKSAVKQLLS